MACVRPHIIEEEGTDLHERRWISRRLLPLQGTKGLVAHGVKVCCGDLELIICAHLAGDVCHQADGIITCNYVALQRGEDVDLARFAVELAQEGEGTW